MNISPNTKGMCSGCNKLFAKQSALKHVEKCFSVYQTKPVKSCYVVKATDQTKAFWVYLLVPTQHTLEDIDIFLRELWLECCGHLSMFTVNGQRYYSICYEPGDVPMDVKCSDVVAVGSEFSYEYDFGSTTDLNLEILAEVIHPARQVQLLMRNEMPKFTCEECKQPAIVICAGCFCLSCKKCGKNDRCQQKEYLYPLLNSPRTGVCGYVG